MSEEILAEMMLTDEQGDSGHPYIPPLANTPTPGLIYTIQPSANSNWSLNGGCAQIGVASPTIPGLFAGLQDYDGSYFPDGLKRYVVDLPAYAKRVQDIHGNQYALSELVGGVWQAATIATCTLPDGTNLYLRLRTDRNGDTLIFELSTNQYYSS